MANDKVKTKGKRKSLSPVVETVERVRTRGGAHRMTLKGDEGNTFMALAIEVAPGNLVAAEAALAALLALCEQDERTSWVGEIDEKLPFFTKGLSVRIAPSPPMTK